MATDPTPAPRPDDEPGSSRGQAVEVDLDELDDLDDAGDLGLDDEGVAVGVAEPYGLLTRLGTEVFGTFVLVLAAVGAALYTPLSGLTTLGVALAAGFALAGLYAAFAHVSGAHLNPAVSIAAALAGRIRATDAAMYIVGQVVAGVAAVAVLRVTVPSGLSAALQHPDLASFLGTAANGYGDGSPLSTLSGGQVTFGLVPALLVELIGAAALAAVVLATRPSARSALPVGLTYAAMLLIAIPVTNGGLNPARSTGAALLSLGADGGQAVPQLWLFWVAPLIGGALAGLAKLALGRREQLAVLPEE
ncbi:MAG TPA: aquaporin [Actinotalea sp.]|nr:aquaporin [Actinotalea sp.]